MLISCRIYVPHHPLDLITFLLSNAIKCMLCNIPSSNFTNFSPVVKKQSQLSQNQYRGFFRYIESGGQNYSLRQTIIYFHYLAGTDEIIIN